MGCLNSGIGFKHWFGNIHLSGPCNRRCYFCIGQHMMALDGENVLGAWPLPGLDEFAATCADHGVTIANVTGTNTDPALYLNHEELVWWLRGHGFVDIGIRTNGVAADRLARILPLYDHASVTVCSFDEGVNRAMMGGSPPDVRRLAPMLPSRRWKANVVLGPENDVQDLLRTICLLAECGVHKVNLREPYGQPHVGDPLAERWSPAGSILGAPLYMVGHSEVVYWDVHFVEVESVNLYATGRVSIEYPITKGHADDGVVRGQEHWKRSGRHHEQWIGGG